jgi:phospholipase/carboxylesterase
LDAEIVSLEVITVPPASGQKPKGTIVLLHGWGANYQDLLSLAPYLDLPDTQFVFPNAPFDHPYGPSGRMWYDFPSDYSFIGSAEFGDRPDLTSSRQQLTELLAELPDHTGIPLSETILGGFSQGGAMTLDVGLNLPLKALMVLSGYVHTPLKSTLAEPMPVLLVHGRQDQVVPIQAAQQANSQLQALGVPVKYLEFNMGHEIQPVVLEQIQAFVKQTFTDSKPEINS